MEKSLIPWVYRPIALNFVSFEIEAWNAQYWNLIYQSSWNQTLHKCICVDWYTQMHNAHCNKIQYGWFELIFLALCSFSERGLP